MLISELDNLIKTVCPIEGIDSNGGIQFLPEATPQQKLEAQALMDLHLPSLVIPAAF